MSTVADPRHENTVRALHNASVGADRALTACLTAQCGTSMAEAAQAADHAMIDLRAAHGLAIDLIRGA